MAIVSDRPSVCHDGVETLRPQDTSAPRHFGTGAEVSQNSSAPVPKCPGHFGTGAEVS